MEEAKLQDMVFKLLEPGIYKTTAQVVEEFRMEYPEAWRQLEKEGEMLFGSSCSSVQQPVTRISRVLFSLPTDRCFSRRNQNVYRWSKNPAFK